MSCPICAKEADAKYRPFCSRRCADVDLGKWLTGSYALPSPDEGAGADDADGSETEEASSANLAKPLRPV